MRKLSDDKIKEIASGVLNELADDIKTDVFSQKVLSEDAKVNLSIFIRTIFFTGVEGINYDVEADRVIEYIFGSGVSKISSVAELVKVFCDIEEDCEFRNAYSGRNMYGRQCVGIVTYGRHLSMLVRLADFLRDSGINSVYDAFGNVCMDNIGQGAIIYFPDLQN